MSRFKIVDKQNRGVLGEGRNYGMGFAFCKQDGDTLTTVMPISPCKDYLNDVVYSEHSGQPYQAHGLKTAKKHIFDSQAYILFAICKQGHPGFEYKGYAKDLKDTDDNLKNIEKLINDIEMELKLIDGTHIVKVSDNLYAAEVPIFWVSTTYAISLWSLLARVARKWDGKGDWRSFLKKINDNDTGYINSSMPKIEKMMKGIVPPQDFSVTSWPGDSEGYGYSVDVHNAGIVNFKFP